MAFTIKINGTDRTVDVDGDTPLLWVLRDVLGMTGTKFGCGMALCGACTVHVDGTATRSCITTIDSVGTSAITTIEAIGETPAGQKIEAWLISTSCSVVTASPARSCRRPRSSRRSRSRPTPTSTTPCPATSAAAAPTSAFVRPSSRRRSPPLPTAREAAMLIDRLASFAADNTSRERNLSRRGFLTPVPPPVGACCWASPYPRGSPPPKPPKPGPSRPMPSSASRAMAV